eukprot:Amastigsp_a191314_119.p1 type:complete len:224 gc:universal Amastigsp_a191314_119:72-743(+)
MQVWAYYVIGGVSGLMCIVAIVCSICNASKASSSEDEEKQSLMQRRPRARRESRTAAMIPTTQTEFNTKINALASSAVPFPHSSVEAIRSQQRDYFGVSPSEVNQPSEFYSRSMLERLQAEQTAAEGALPIPTEQEWRTEAEVTLAPSSLNSTYYQGSFEDTPTMPSTSPQPFAEADGALVESNSFCAVPDPSTPGPGASCASDSQGIDAPIVVVVAASDIEP